MRRCCWRVHEKEEEEASSLPAAGLLDYPYRESVPLFWGPYLHLSPVSALPCWKKLEIELFVWHKDQNQIKVDSLSLSTQNDENTYYRLPEKFVSA